MTKRKKGPNILRNLVILVTLVLSVAVPVTTGNSMPEGVPGAGVMPQQPDGPTTVFLPFVTNAAVARPGSITLQVVAARTEPKAFDGAGVTKGDPILEYEYLISVDNTGDPKDDNPDCQPLNADGTRNLNYPGTCNLPSIRTVPGWAPIYTQGTDQLLNQSASIVLTPGKYLISVMADGYKIDGQHFTIPEVDPDPYTPMLVQVEMHPLPLPPAAMVIKVFNDRSMTNGQYDAPVEEGLQGFRAAIHDILGEITTDLFGNPLCTIYETDLTTGEVLLDEDGAPVIQTLGAGCYSDANGEIHISNIGPLRYDVLVIPPDGQHWVQTTTLEGSQGWDTWLQEAGTGLDNEFVVAGEPFPWTVFGFVQPTADLPVIPNGGSIQGVIAYATVYTPTEGGLPYRGTIWGGLAGAKISSAAPFAWVSLNDLQNGDTAIWVGQADAEGVFQIENVPPGNYFIAYWDEKQHYILDWMQVSVDEGQITDVGTQMLTGWFTEVTGTVFDDYNENGKRDPGEPGIPNYTVVLKDRDNTEIDRMSIASVTDVNGYYALEKAYPMGSWMVLEAYHDSYRTTGVTFQASNQPEPTTVLGNGVDVDILPILGQSGRLDWGVRPYGPGMNGGIVGTVFYDTVRNEDDAQYGGIEPFLPGIPDLVVNLYPAMKDASGNYVKNADGSYTKGQLLNSAITETFARPVDCTPRGVDGTPIDFLALAPHTGGYPCLEAPMMGTQFGTEFATLDGNYGLTEGCFGPGGYDPEAGACADGNDPTSLPAGDYLVEVVIPNDPITGEPVFQVTREEDRNVFNGDTWTPQVIPPACAGPVHIVDVAGYGQDNYPALPGTMGPSVPVDNPALVENGGSQFEGMPKPLCNVKLVPLHNERSIAPTFNLFTPVTIPGRWKGYIINDLVVSTNPNELFFGEMAGLSNIPIGLYDYAGRLVETIISDRHGVFEALLPSTDTFNAPTPAGILANVYYMYGNDPGQPDRPNPDYNPQYRSIGASFEIYPGVIVPSDLAPVLNGATILSPTSQQSSPAACKLEDTTPQLFAVDKPYVRDTGSITITGIGFGLVQGLGQVTLDGTPLPAASIVSWDDRQITISINSQVPSGPHQLLIQADNRQTTVNGLTIHVLREGEYNPTVFEVGPGKTFDPTNTTLYDGTGRGPIQAAIDAAIELPAGQEGLVVIYPNQAVEMLNPLGWYLENPIIYHPVKIQGVGPGGLYPEGTPVAGTILDGRPVGGDALYSDWWRARVHEIWRTGGGWGTWTGGGEIPEMPLVYEGAVFTVLAAIDEFGAEYNAAIDGMIIQGGDQQGFPNNINIIGGNPIPGAQPIVVVQGGGVYVDSYGNNLQITNNHVRSNGGAYGGGIRLGTPHLVPQDNNNDNVVIAHNRLLANGGTNLAGAIGVFAGAENYEIAHNDICGNYSAEYGGGISHYGLSPNGQIHHNRIYFNSSYDEGGGIMIAGELPADPTELTLGAGPVDIYANLIQGNLGNDDGGGLRFLMAGNFPYNVYNNVIVNNVSTHEGGGISLNDASDVRIYNNTILKNITTATAMTSTGAPAPAGLSSSRNSALFAYSLDADDKSKAFSNPLLFNNLFWDNRAGSWNGRGVSGIGQPGDPAPLHYWDLGVADGSGELTSTYSMMQQVPEGLPDATNIVGSTTSGVIGTYDTSVVVLPWRGNQNFIGANIVAVDVPVTLLGNYHLSPGSPARDGGTPSQPLGLETIFAPDLDIEGDSRPRWRGFDIGADEDITTLFWLPQIWND